MHSRNIYMGLKKNLLQKTVNWKRNFQKIYYSKKSGKKNNFLRVFIVLTYWLTIEVFGQVAHVIGQLAHVVSFWMVVFWNGKHVTLCQIVVLCREPCSVHLKSGILKCKMFVKQKMCLDFWKLEKKFCSLCVRLNNCAVHVILVC